MAITYERILFAPLSAITAIDRFVQLRGTNGPFPPPLGALRVSSIARIVQGTAAAIDPPWLLRAETNGAAVYRFSGEATAGTRPPFTVAPDRYRLRIDSDFYQRAEIDLDWPVRLDQMPIVLLMPGYAYPFPDLTLPRNTITLVRGSLFEAGGASRAIEGAIVSITVPANTWPFNTCVTDANGSWALVVPLGATAPAFVATLHFSLPAGSSFDVDVAVQPGLDNALPQTALRGVVQSTTGTPIDRAVVTVGNLSDTAATGRDGRWSFYFSLTQADVQLPVTAVAPNGQSQTQFANVINRATVVVPAFSLPMN